MTRATTMFEEGDPEARIVFLGEAPSFMEVREGKPFVGPAGQLFDRLLQAAQISRRESYIINVFEEPVTKNRDDGNKLYNSNGDLLWTATKGFTDAGRAASANSLRRLSDCRANVIVPLGGVALTLVLGETRSVTKWRGSIIGGNGTGTVRKTIPTIHPSACLKGVYEYRYLIVSDLKKAKRESSSPDLKLPQRNLIIDPEYDQCVSFLKRCLDSPIVNTDIELLNGQVDCFSLAVTPSEAISIPFLDVGFEHRFSPEEEFVLWKLYAQVLAASHITKVNQNITFDFATLFFLNNIIPQGPIHDPMVAHSVMYPFLPKNLGTLCSLYTDEPYYKDDGVLENSFTINDFSRRWLYSAKDSAVSLESWLWLEPHIESDGYQATYDMTMNAIPSLIYMMSKGLRVDVAALAQTKIDTEAACVDLVKRMENVFNCRIITALPKTAAAKREAAGALNINSPAQIASYFYDKKKLKPYLNKAGARSVDDLALSRIVRRDGLEEARLMQEYRKITTIISRYLSAGYDDDNHMRCSYNARGAWSGRLSSQQTVFDTGMNLQNLYPEFRGFLISEEGIDGAVSS